MPIPIRSDRSAHDDLSYGTLHAKDIDLGTYRHHLPNAADGEVPVKDTDGYWYGVPFELTELLDVDLTSGSSFNTGDVLIWNGTKWVPTSGSGLSGDLSLDDLVDVSAPSPQSGQVLTYNASTLVWEAANTAASMGDLFDVDLTGLDIGDTLVWNGEMWVPGIASGSSANAMVDLTDVDYAPEELENGDHLQWSVSSQKWVRWELTSSSGGGDMYKAVYDANDDGVVDAADVSDDATHLDGHSGSYFSAVGHSHSNEYIEDIGNPYDLIYKASTSYSKSYHNIAPDEHGYVIYASADPNDTKDHINDDIPEDTWWSPEVSPVAGQWFTWMTYWPHSIWGMIIWQDSFNEYSHFATGVDVYAQRTTSGSFAFVQSFTISSEDQLLEFDEILSLDAGGMIKIVATAGGSTSWWVSELILYEYYHGWGRIPIGSDGDVLQVTSGSPAWGDIPDHSHVEADIADLVHDAAKIAGRDVDLVGEPVDGQVMIWRSSSNKWVYETSGSTVAVPDYLPVFNEAISTTGSDFSTDYTFLPDTLRVTWNGVRQAGTDFSEKSDKTGFTTAFAVSADDSLVVDYHRTATAGSQPGWWNGDAHSLMGRNISGVAPSSNQALLWDATDQQWEPSAVVTSGSVTKYKWEPLLPPETANAKDDEFDDSSVDVKWTEWDVAGIQTVSEGTHGLKLLHTSGADKVAGVYQTAPSLPYTIWTKVNAFAHRSDDYKVGILLGQDLASNPSTSDAYLYAYYVGGAGACGIQVVKYSDYQSVSSTIENEVWTTPAVNWFFRLRVYSSSGIKAVVDMSLDGISWLRLKGPHTLDFTPAQIGLASIANTAATAWPAHTYFPFFRVTASSDWDQFLGGGRIALARA